MTIRTPIELRHYLHQYPEVSDSEIRTSATIKRYFQENLPEFKIHEVGVNGVVMEFDTGFPGKEIMYRTELDALPIDETIDLHYKSQIPGVSHKCGHDGHMAILTQLAHDILKVDMIQLSGRILLLFQPAEENGNGAKEILGDKSFQDKFNPDEIYALHNVPGYNLDEIVCKDGNFTPSVISAVVKVKGYTAHAGEPLNGKNPFYFSSSLIPALSALDNHDISSDSYQIITPIYSNIGQPDFGISAGEGELGFTMRAWTEEQMNLLQESFKATVQEIADKQGFKVEIEWLLEFSSINNDTNLVDKLKDIALKLNLQYTNKEKPFT